MAACNRTARPAPGVDQPCEAWGGELPCEVLEAPARHPCAGVFEAPSRPAEPQAPASLTATAACPHACNPRHFDK